MSESQLTERKCASDVMNITSYSKTDMKDSICSFVTCFLFMSRRFALFKHLMQDVNRKVSGLYPGHLVLLFISESICSLKRSGFVCWQQQKPLIMAFLLWTRTRARAKTKSGGDGKPARCYWPLKGEKFWLPVVSCTLTLCQETALPRLWQTSESESGQR